MKRISIVLLTAWLFAGLPAHAIPPGSGGGVSGVDIGVTVQAYDDLWGCSADSSPFDFTRPMTGGVVNIRLVR